MDDSPPDQPFSNEPLDVAGLPAVDRNRFESLDPNYLRVRLIGDVVFAVVVVVAAVIVAMLVTWWWLPLAIGAGLLALTALAAWLQTIEVGHIGYLVREHDFSFRRGVISQNVTTVPFARVQHVSIDRGPLARRFGMATLQMRTAGDGLTVPGISHDVAQRLKALVVDRAGALAEEEFAHEETATEPWTTAPPPSVPSAPSIPPGSGPPGAVPPGSGPPGSETPGAVPPGSETPAMITEGRSTDAAPAGSPDRATGTDTVAGDG